MYPGNRETGFSIPAPKQQQYNGGGFGGQEEIPYHAEVLPVKASPKGGGGFGDVAFKPLLQSPIQKQKGFGKN